MPEGIRVDYKVEGLYELEMALRNLPDKIAKKYLGAALRKGLNVTATRERQLAPKGQTRNLEKSIMIYVRNRNRMAGATIEYGVKPVQKKWGRKGYHALLVEYGTKRHRIPTTGEKPMPIGYGGGAGRRPGQTIFASHVWVQAKPKPFINPAINETVWEAIRVAEDYLADKCEVEINTSGLGYGGQERDIGW